MKRILSILLTIVLLAGLVPAFGTEVPACEIVNQPWDTSTNAGEYVSFHVTAVGEYLSCQWFIIYQGNTYFLEDTGSGAPWLAHAGSDFGAYRNGNTFSYYFTSPGAGLDGAKFYAVITDGHFEAYSDEVTLTVNPGDPVLSINVPAYIDTCVGETIDIYCSATDSAGGELSYLWYYTNTEDITGIIAVNRGTEDSDTLTVHADSVGVTFYCCMVSSTSGVSEYSDLVRVIVYDAPYSEVDPPDITTQTIAEATVGEAYWARLSCTDPNATFDIYNNPGKPNEFGSTGLYITDDGAIGGYPAAPGTYTFTVCASGEGGEDYATFTLTIKEAAVTTEATTTEATTAEATDASTEKTAGKTEITTGTEPPPATENTTVLPSTAASTQGTPESSPAVTDGSTLAPGEPGSQSSDIPDSDRINPDLEHGLPRKLRIALFTLAIIVLILLAGCAVAGTVLIIKKLTKK